MVNTGSCYSYALANNRLTCTIMVVIIIIIIIIIIATILLLQSNKVGISYYMEKEGLHKGITVSKPRKCKYWSFGNRQTLPNQQMAK